MPGELSYITRCTSAFAQPSSVPSLLPSPCLPSSRSHLFSTGHASLELGGTVPHLPSFLLVRFLRCTTARRFLSLSFPRPSFVPFRPLPSFLHRTLPLFYSLSLVLGSPLHPLANLHPPSAAPSPPHRPRYTSTRTLDTGAASDYGHATIKESAATCERGGQHFNRISFARRGSFLFHSLHDFNSPGVSYCGALLLTEKHYFTHTLPQMNPTHLQFKPQ